jgi:hypothetical protein
MVAKVLVLFDDITMFSPTPQPLSHIKTAKV